jgi:hypothetical protein
MQVAETIEPFTSRREADPAILQIGGSTATSH